jgi:hypothetical protein
LKISAVGRQSLYSNTTGDCNVALGYNSLFSNNTTANDNTGVGTHAMFANTTGTEKRSSR